MLGLLAGMFGFPVIVLTMQGRRARQRSTESTESTEAPVD
jgi:hypothetical protein